ncbi:MAG: polysaccharide biosynthesis tyrosine autokinase [Gemmatimonadaceae bacterium]
MMIPSDNLYPDPGSKMAVTPVLGANGDGGDEFAVERQETEQSLRDRLQVVRRYIFLILAVAGVVAGVRAWQLSKMVPVYLAQSTIRFSDSRSNLTAGVGINDPSRMSSYYIDALKSQMALLSSRAVTEEAVDTGKLQLREVTTSGAINFISALDASRVQKTDTLRLSFEEVAVAARYGSVTAAAPYGSSLAVGALAFTVASRPPGVRAASFVAIPRDEAINSLQEEVRPSIRKETDVADISFRSTDPVFAQRAVNAVTLSFQTMNFRSSQQGAKARRQFIESQLRKTDSVLSFQRGQLSDFRSSAQTYSSKDKISAEQQSLAAIEMRRAELQADRQVFQSLLARAMNARSGESSSGLRALISAPGIAANPVIAQLYSQFADLVRSRDSLTTGPFPAAPSSPDLQRLNALIRSTSDDLINAVKSQIEGLDARIASLTSMSQKSAAQVSALPRSEAEESRLLQDVEGTQRMVQQLQEEEQRARISEVAQGGQVEIVDVARLPEVPLNQGRSRQLVLAGIFGLMLGMGLAFLLDGMNSSLRRFEEVERIFQLPTLAVIPNLDGQKALGSRAMRLPGRSRHTAGNGSNAGTNLVKPETPAFEAFRALRTSLIFSDAVRSLKTIVVTSAAPGDGKSTMTANLAAAFAQQGMRVLAVDCDFRRGRLHKYFGFSRSPGLTNMVLGECGLEDAVRETSIPNLFVLSSGANPPNSTELLGSDAVRQILLRLISEYDVVILDSPPILATADAAILSSIADGVVMVVRMGETDRDAARRALQRLEIVGARILGTIINDPDNVLGSSEEYYYAYSATDSAT